MKYEFKACLGGEIQKENVKGAYLKKAGIRISENPQCYVQKLMLWPGICGTQVLSSVRMKKTQESSKWLFLGNLIPKIKSKAPN